MRTTTGRRTPVGYRGSRTVFARTPRIVGLGTTRASAGFRTCRLPCATTSVVPGSSRKVAAPFRWLPYARPPLAPRNRAVSRDRPAFSRPAITSRFPRPPTTSHRRFPVVFYTFHAPISGCGGERGRERFFAVIPLRDRTVRRIDRIPARRSGL